MDRGAFTLPALAGVVLLAFGVSEALTKKPDLPGKVHVAYWEKWTDFEFQAMKDVVDDFNRSQDKIQVDILSVSSIQDKTLMAISGNVPPDLAGLYGPNVTQYADDHAVLPLDDMCREAGIKAEQYIPVFWDIGVARGHIYGLPATPGSIALHYNTKMFKEAGLDPDKPPQTFDELFAVSEKLTKVDPSGKVTLAGFLPAEPGWWNWMWGPFFGGRWWDGGTKITANCPENVRAYEWVQQFAKKYGPGQLQSFRSGFGNFSSPQNGFLAEHLAMVPQGVWMYNFIKKFSPNLQWKASPMPHPSDRPDLANGTLVDLDVLCIPRGAKHPKEAFEFIKYVQSQKGMEKLCLGQKKATPLRAVSPGFFEKHPNPFIQLFATLPYSKTLAVAPKLGIWPEYQSEIDSAFDSIMLMQKTPKQALDDIQARMQPKLDQYLTRLKVRGEE
ncbi:ABC transporter substrate-binding protein [Fimbriimonas ginsengisoli]|uniref:Sugar ABC transporter, sugar-binding protein n=1 Tax=Fimbriimonas ginsengisoli Gsoil 348 TaxID=661478 RepID=A0A068NMY9_FIMGI|nr:ABC transporter substrate-binding protein [Fimbriimonas ginsengisoli]AIE84085.1 Sugar ABC transporter, sugar-binding protein [Fimbriimonas ginsengisoli Gsoil 348]